MRTGGRTRGVGTGEFVEEPMRWRTQALLMLLSVGKQVLAGVQYWMFMCDGRVGSEDDHYEVAM